MIRRALPAWLPVLVLLACAASGAEAATVIAPEPDTHAYSVGLSMDMLEDETASLDIDAVSSSLYADRYVAVHKEMPNYGFRRSALWFRFTVDFRGDRDRAWHLLEAHPILDHITFYMPDGAGGWHSVNMGDTLPFGARDYKVREFVARIPRPVSDSAAPVTFYARAAGLGALNINIQLLDERALAERVNAQEWAYGLFYGALVIMLLYNVLLYWSVREKSQSYYIVWLAGFILLFMSLSGHGLQFLWPDAEVIDAWFPAFICIAFWGALNFTRIFLDIRRDNPRTDTAFRWLTTAVVVVFILSLLLPTHWIYILGTALPVFFAIVMLSAGIVRLRQGYLPARLFVAGWSVLLVGSFVMPLANFGLLPLNEFTKYSPQAGVVLQVILLSLALGDRMRFLKRETERIEQESRGKLEQMLAQVRSLDADKSRFLQYLSHELNTPLNWMASTRTLDKAAIEPGLRAMIDSVESGQQRMIDLVGTVLGYFDLASEVPGTTPVVPVAPMWLVDDLLRERVAVFDRRKLRVTNRVPADLVVLANEQRLRRVLASLIDNAVNFSDPGQEIELVGGTESYGTRGVIAVRDRGAGIDAERLPRLFEPFFMVGSHHRDGGFGLSLATARLLVEHMDGDLRARSAGRGQGAEFMVVLPTVPPVKAPGAVAPPGVDREQTPAA